MTARKAITPQMKIDALMYRLATGNGIHFSGIPSRPTGAYFICGICRNAIALGTKIHWDHIHAISMGGPHTFRNLRPTHAACNQAKGIKEHRAKAKVGRILGLTCNGPKKHIPSRPFSKPRAANFPLSTTQKDE